MDFDNIISNALKHENDLYLKKYSNSLFRISKRDKSRLELTCRYDKTCKYLIRCKKSAGIVTFHKKTSASYLLNKRFHQTYSRCKG